MIDLIPAIKVLVTGSHLIRETPQLDDFVAKHLSKYINYILVEEGKINPDIIIIHGGASGIDKTVTRAATRLGYHNIKCYPANWVKYGKGAGPIRNQEMLDKEKPTHGLVFQGGPGTRDMMTRLHSSGIPFWFVGNYVAKY